MSALWWINLWVTAFFTVVTLACMGLLLHQVVADVERELQSACAPRHNASDPRLHSMTQRELEIFVM